MGNARFVGLEFCDRKVTSSTGSSFYFAPAMLYYICHVSYAHFNRNVKLTPLVKSWSFHRIIGHADRGFSRLISVDHLEIGHHSYCSYLFAVHHDISASFDNLTASVGTDSTNNTRINKQNTWNFPSTFLICIACLVLRHRDNFTFKKLLSIDS
jgi:hypothetical protein